MKMPTLESEREVEWRFVSTARRQNQYCAAKVMALEARWSDLLPRPSVSFLVLRVQLLIARGLITVNAFYVVGNGRTTSRLCRSAAGGHRWVLWSTHQLLAGRVQFLSSRFGCLVIVIVEWWVLCWSENKIWRCEVIREAIYISRFLMQVCNNL